MLGLWGWHRLIESWKYHTHSTGSPDSHTEFHSLSHRIGRLRGRESVCVNMEGGGVAKDVKAKEKKGGEEECGIWGSLSRSVPDEHSFASKAENKDNTHAVTETWHRLRHFNQCSEHLHVSHTNTNTHKCMRANHMCTLEKEFRYSYISQQGFNLRRFINVHHDEALVFWFLIRLIRWFLIINMYLSWHQKLFSL